eukprot:6220874-Prorocentrum_lima.AAC.1
MAPSATLDLALAVAPVSVLSQEEGKQELSSKGRELARPEPGSRCQLEGYTSKVGSVRERGLELLCIII